MRADLEPRLGHDLSRIRIHDGPRADEAARGVFARAFTTGEHIAFRGGHYRPRSAAGRRLIAHEVVHAIQQGAISPLPGHPSPVATSPSPPRVARALDFTAIRQAILAGNAPQNQQGVVGHGAAFPGRNGLAAATESTVPTDTNLPIRAYYFRAANPTTHHRAFIHGGIHGTEISAYEIADDTVQQMQSTPPPMHTLVIPRVNPGGIADHCRCNRQDVDLNRNYAPRNRRHPCRIWHQSRNPARQNAIIHTYLHHRYGRRNCICGNDNRRAPKQPETKVLEDAVNHFQPERILALHAIHNPASGGVYADPPRSHGLAHRLALHMADALPHSLTRANARDNTRYGQVTPGSFGHWAPRQHGHAPVLTLEVPGYRALSRTGGDRSIRSYRTAVDRFFEQNPPRRRRHRRHHHH